MFNISFKRVGGLRILKIGRITFTMSVARVYESPAQIAERKALEKARRAALREEERFNAKIGRQTRVNQLRLAAIHRLEADLAENGDRVWNEDELTAFLEQGWEVDESHPANWH
jgi:hypothetical protein